MKLTRLTQGLLLAALLSCGAAATAQVSFRINIGPPAQIFEPVPMLAPGTVWAPGYWAWNNDRHIWIRGRAIYQRPGYRWEPDRWEQRGNSYYRQPGNWTRDDNFQPPRALPGPQFHQPTVQHGKPPKARSPKWKKNPHQDNRR